MSGRSSFAVMQRVLITRKFYAQLDHIILLTVPARVIVERLAARATNSYGKRPEEVGVRHASRGGA